MLERLPQHSFSCYQDYVLIFKNQPFLMWYVRTTEKITVVKTQVFLVTTDKTKKRINAYLMP